jgi:hypothetical protein
MAGSQSFMKRQKERARQEKQAEKNRRKLERRQNESTAPAERPNGPLVTHDEEGQPRELDFHDFA